jgi:large subunit ribosomal protein L23
MKDVYSIIDKALLTEKGSRLSSEENKYLFQVQPGSNKVEIKRAVEELFDVTVLKVNTLNRKGKKKRERTRNFGKTAATRRAVVTLKEGDSIDLM